MQSLVLDSTLVGAGDLHVFAVFGDSAARDLDTLGLEDSGDLLVRERVLRVFVFDKLFDATLEDEQRCSATLRALHALAEEVAEFEDSLRCVDVFVRDGAADGRRMYTDLFG